MHNLNVTYRVTKSTLIQSNFKNSNFKGKAKIFDLWRLCRILFFEKFKRNLTSENGLKIL